MDKDLHRKNSNEHVFPRLTTEEKIMFRTSQYKVPFPTSKETALEKLKMAIQEGKTSESGSQKRPIRKIYIWTAAAAASVLLIFGIAHFLFLKPLTQITCLKGEHTTYQLPDGSSVALNAESNISFGKAEFLNKRYLKMDGEAFFNIQKGKQFIINTKFADIHILGTSFNVFARDNNFNVSCVTGKILVTSTNQSVIIIPGECAVILQGKLIKQRFGKNNEDVAAWRQGEFYYENTDVKTIFKEIERQYNVIFVVEDVNKFFTGSFSNKNLQNTLDIICIPMGLTYEYGKNGKIYIHQKKQ